MLRKTGITLAVAAVAALGSAGAANAAVTFDPATGEGFVGKGDVQLAFGWNNKALNENAAAVGFESDVVSEVSWVCTKDNGNTQERERTTTTEGLVAHVTRDNKRQITGFTLTGYSGSTTTSSDGPKLNTCPDKWELTVPAGDPEIVGGGLYVLHGSSRVLL